MTTPSYLDYNYCGQCGKELIINSRPSPFGGFLFTYKECPDKRVGDAHYSVIIKSGPIGPYDPITGKLK